MIVSAAFDMIDEKGKGEFSVRQLASKLDVQVSSLYNHIKNENDLLMEVAKRSAVLYSECIAETVQGLERDEATLKAGEAFRVFLKEHEHLYELLLDARWLGDPEFEKAIESFTQPIYFIMDQYGIEDKETKDHLYVIMRTVTHGFSTLYSLGVFDNLSIDATESYNGMIMSVIEAMKRLGNNSEDTK